MASTLVDEKLRKWVAARFVDITSEGSISRLELYHAVDGEHGEKMSTTVVEEGGNPDDAAQMIWDEAEHDATTRYTGAPNRYVVQAYRAANDEPDSSHAFVLRGRASPNYMLGNDTDAPTERGERGQMLRHNQQMHQLIMQVSEGSVGRVMRENEQLRDRLDRMEKMSMDMFDKYQELHDRKSQRDREEAREQARERRHDQLMTMFMAVGPAVLSSMLGSKGMPGSITGAVRDQGIMKFLKGLDEKQMGAILSTLRTDQQLALYELYKSYREEDKKEQAEKHPVLRDPEQNSDRSEALEPLKH